MVEELNPDPPYWDCSPTREQRTHTGGAVGRQGGPGSRRGRGMVEGKTFSLEGPGCAKCWSQRPFCVFRPQTDERWSGASAEATPSPAVARGAERGLAPTELRGAVSLGWKGGQEGGGALWVYKGADRTVRFLHSLESSSEPGAIAKPERTARRRGRLLLRASDTTT